MDSSTEIPLKEPYSPWGLLRSSQEKRDERGGRTQSGNLTKVPLASSAPPGDYGEEEATLGSHHQQPYSRLARTHKFQPQPRCR